MSGQVEFALLGPMQVRAGGTVMPVLPGKQRALLAALLLRANRRVSLDELVEAIWGPEPPAAAFGTLRDYVKELRKSLQGIAGPRISTMAGGYQIRVDTAELDIFRFEALRHSARSAAARGSWEQATAELGLALSLWRGAPLADVPSESLALREVPRLTELYLHALESRIEADLQLGRQGEVVADLRHVITEHPLRERLHALLMLALYRDGRQAEALAAYQQARRVLIDEVGAEPGLALRQLEQQILREDPALAAQPPTDRQALGHPDRAKAQPADSVVPRQLPAAVSNFTGRAAELGALRAQLAQAAGDGLAVIITAIAGTAGVGKTALAVHVAHQTADQFPDGQLYVNLRGYDPAEPMSPPDAIGGFLRALGVAGHDIAADAAERAAQYRSLLAGRRILLLLDNAKSAEQVRPLLPGAPGTVVLVTSRDSLAGLVARDGAWRLELDRLPGAEASSLLRALVGARGDAEPEMVEALAIQCSRLPLALRIAAELVVSRPASSLADLVTELNDQTRRLELLNAVDDEQSAVRAVFSWSYRHLKPDAARTFRFLGLHPGADFDCGGVAALTAKTAGQARAALEDLAQAHLVHTVTAGRYEMHDLLRAYAAELAVSQEPQADRDSAMTCLFDYYLYRASAAVQFLFPASESGTAPGPAAYMDGAQFADPPAARAWLDDERANLVTIAAHTADSGSPMDTPRLAASLFRYLEGGGHYAETSAICEYARRAAHRSGDKVAEAEAYNNGTVVDLRQGRYPEAAFKLGQALELYRRVGDHVGQARALGNLGIVAMLQGGYERAGDYQQQALDLYQQAGNQAGEMRTLTNMGSIDLRQGRYPQATQRFQRTLDLSRQLGSQTSEGYSLASLGIVGLRQGEAEEASGKLELALSIFREISDPTGEAFALSGLGAADRRQGRYQQARRRHEQGMALCREHGDQPGEAEALNSIGELLLATGDPDKARLHHESALALASRVGDKYELARAHNGLAETCSAAGNQALALHHWRQALGFYTDLGAPEASQISATLDVLPNARPALNSGGRT